MASPYATAFLDLVEWGTVRLRARLFGVPWVVRYLHSPNPRLSARLLRAFGAQIGQGTSFKRRIYLDNVYEDQDSAGDFSRLRIGANCYIGDGVYFDLANGVELGDDVVVSGEVAFITHTDCNRSAGMEREFPRRCMPVTVGRGAWVGFRATPLNGVTVGPLAAIAAHALVNRDVQGQVLAGGVPAKPIRPLRGA